MRPGAAFPLLAFLLVVAAPPAGAWSVVVQPPTYEGPGGHVVGSLIEAVTFWVTVTLGDECIGVDVHGSDPCEHAGQPGLGAGVGVDLGFIAVCVEETQVRMNDACQHAMMLRALREALP